MPLTKPFKDTVVERAKVDPEFRAGLLTEAAECFLRGEVGPAKTILRNYINATIGFGGLAENTKLSKPSLMRMLSEKGNPQAGNLAAIIASLNNHEGVNLHVEALRSRIAPH